ncbi:MAG: pirin family protein [Pseudohongiellaceae bacterium]|jgi:redox-sensitive bicupin YhaK (pirin superfamily)
MSNAIISTQVLGLHWEVSDPFLFCAFHNDKFPKGNERLGPDASLAGRPIGQDFQLKDGWRMYHGQRVAGFPVHPHRGFETVSIVPVGLVDHADSMGAAGRYGNGDVQWLTTGRGVQHSEMFPLLNRNADNPLLFFQIWLNLPAESKMAKPHFAMFWNEEIPVYETQDEAGNSIKIKVVAGEIDGVKALAPPPDSWAARAESKVNMWLIDLAPAASWTLAAESDDLNRRLYFYDGNSIQADGHTIAANTGIHLNSGLDFPIKNTGDKTARFLLLQGKPIGEPVAQYGPFVMNTRRELEQAFSDYQRDQFGGWPWQHQDQVHGRRGRFAIHEDGREEEPV